VPDAIIILWLAGYFNNKKSSQRNKQIGKLFLQQMIKG
jgi:hypothetical protein